MTTIIEEDVVPVRKRLVATQDNAGATSIIIDIALSVGGIAQIDVLRTGADNYAATRQVVCSILNEANQTVENIGNIAAVDNQGVHWSPVVPTATPAVDNDGRRVGGPWRLYGGDKIRLIVGAAAQAETLTAQLRAMVRGVLTITSVSAGVSLVETDD